MVFRKNGLDLPVADCEGMRIFLKLWQSTFLDVFENGDAYVQCRLKSGSSGHQHWDRPICASPVSTVQPLTLNTLPLHFTGMKMASNPPSCQH